MPFHNFQDFVIYTSAIAKAGTDRKGRPKQFSLRVFDSPVGEGERDEKVDVPDWKELEICRTALARQRIPVKDFQAFARRLGKMILPAYARGLYYSSLSKIEEENNGLRVRLYLLPALACLPWEYTLVELHEGEVTAQDYWGQDHRISIVRHEMITVPAPPFRSTPHRRVIFAMASPPDEKYPKLNLRDEQKGIRDAMNSVIGIDAEYHPDYAKEPRSTGTTVEAVEEALERPADIFHFSGHGDYREAEPAAWGGRPGRGVLVFDSGRRSAREVRADVISGVLAEGQVRLVVLDACETGQRDMFQRWTSVAMALLKKGIPAVVAMQYSIHDDTAKEFSKRIYEELVAGRTIDEAVTKGRLAISRIDEKTLDWGSPVLYMRNSGGIIFPPVTDEQARLNAEESSQRDSTLNETVMEWTRKGMFASADQLEILEQGGDSLKLAPTEAVLLLRSALVAGRETGHWVAQLHRVGGKWLENIAAAPLPQKEKDVGLVQKCLGLDGRILPPPPEKTPALAWAAVRHPDPMTSQTAALALLAQKNGQAVADIQNALHEIGSGSERRRRRAMLLGTLAESDPEVEKELPRAVDNLQDRCAVWWWRARKHLRANWPKMLRRIFGGALGGALALALFRGIPAFFSTHLAGTEFAVYSYWGFIAGWGLLLGTMLAAPLLLQDYGNLKPEKRRRTAMLAVLLGAAGFCLASTLTMLMNSYSFSLERVLRMIGTSFLVGGGLSLGLIGQPDAGWKLGAGGWLKRLAAVAVVLAIVQLPVLCEAAARPDGSYILPNARWLAAPIIESTQTLADKYFFLNNLFPPYNADSVLDCKRCCYDCASTTEVSLAVRLVQGCFIQWLTVLDAALVGLVLTLGEITGIRLANAAYEKARGKSRA